VQFSCRTPEVTLADLMEKNVHWIYIDGGQVMHSFLREGLVADIVISTFPVLLCSGKPLFGVLPHDIDLTLLSSRSFPSGLVQSHYRLTS
jgi:dihydrofolate reductase